MIELVVFILPVLIAVIFAKRYNFIYGFVVYFSFSAILEGASLLMERFNFLTSFQSTYAGYIGPIVSNVNKPLQDLIVPYLPKFAAGYEYFVVIIGASLVLHIISAIIRKSRIERDFGGRRFR